MPFLIGIFQVYTNKTTTTVKANGAVACQINLVLLSFSKAFKWYLIAYGYTLAKLLSVSTLDLPNGLKEVYLELENSFP